MGEKRKRNESREGGASFVEYLAEKVYVLMGFMPRIKRIRPIFKESEEDAFKRLMKANGFDKDLQTILNTPPQEKSSLNLEQMKTLGKKPNSDVST